jgi:hypothetical protein
MNDMLKHQSMVRINKKFISHIRTKYDKISVGSYLVERMLYTGTNRAYIYNKDGEFIPFYKTISNKNLSTTTTTNNSIQKPLYIELNTNKIMLLSFYKYNCKPKPKLEEYYNMFKIDVKSVYRFPSLLEYTLDTLKYNHIHIEIDKNILLSNVDLDDVDYYAKSK